MNILRAIRASMLCVLLAGGLSVIPTAFGFEGRIAATLARGGETENLLYTVGANYLRIERLETNWPHARDIVNLQSGEMMLLFPHNRSFVRLTSTAGAPPVQPGGRGPGQLGSPSFTPPPMPQMPLGVGPQRSTFGAPATMPMRSVPPMEKIEMAQTNGTTNILGLTCRRYELRQRGQVMEIWATDKLFPFRAYLENQLHRFGPQMIEEQWGGLVAERHLFPLLAVLRFENGPEQMRWEVTAIGPEKIKQEDEAKLFEPPPEYQEVQPLPF